MTHQAPTALIIFSVAAAAFVLLIFILGTLAKWYQEHRILARIFIIGLIIAAIAAYLEAHPK